MSYVAESGVGRISGAGIVSDLYSTASATGRGATKTFSQTVHFVSLDHSDGNATKALGRNTAIGGARDSDGNATKALGR